MAQGGRLTNPTSKSERESVPYPPSWINRFSAWLDQLAGPRWLYYVGLGLVLVLVQATVLWVEGPAPAGTVLPPQVFLAGIISYFLALLPYLDSMADRALATLRPTMKADEEEYDRLRYQLTTLPSRPTLLASLATVIVMNLVTAVFGAPMHFHALVTTSPISAAVLYIIYMVGWWHFGALLYHTIHQLRLIDRIHSRYVHISLFRMSPLYAFSSLTAVTAVSLAFATYGWVAITPDALVGPIGIGMVLIITVMTLAAFVWPVLGIHRLLVQEKGRLLDDASLRLEAAIVQLHQRMDSGDLEGMADLNFAIASLEIEQRALNGIPTWPWQPETVRLLLTALLLPLALLIAQVVVQRISGQ